MSQPVKSSVKRLQYACYTANAAMAVVTYLPPVLFLPLRALYGISYTMLGLLIVVNFCTQLAVDLLFSALSDRLPTKWVARGMPWLTVLGMALYAASPLLFPNTVYTGLLIGTGIVSAASGLAEVLVSPLIASLPLEDPDRQMSLLHAVYAWGAVLTVALSALFLFFAGQNRWQILLLLLAAVPIASGILFAGASVPHLREDGDTAENSERPRKRTLWGCVFLIFLGGAAEATMSQWCSVYLARALGIPKLWGDLLGVAMFCLMLGLGRALYARRGGDIDRVLLLGAMGAGFCYLAAAMSSLAPVGLLACALSGLSVSMLWPGSLILARERIPSGGVLLYGMMAAGGDLGSAAIPQLVGVLTDLATRSKTVHHLTDLVGGTAEQLGVKLGMLVGAVASFGAIPLIARLAREEKRQDSTKENPKSS